MLILKIPIYIVDICQQWKYNNNWLIIKVIKERSDITPRLDKTGPSGKGSKTGRGLGSCKPNQKNIKNNNEEQKKDNESDGLGRRNE